MKKADLTFLHFFFLSYSGSWIKSCPPTWWGWLSLLILLIQMLISPRNTLTDTLRNYALPALWVSCSPVKLTHKINHHSWLPLNTSIRFRCWWTSPKKDKAGSSLAAQELGIHTSIAGAQIQCLVGKLRSRMPLAGPKKKKNQKNKKQSKPSSWTPLRPWVTYRVPGPLLPLPPKPQPWRCLGLWSK